MDGFRGKYNAKIDQKLRLNLAAKHRLAAVGDLELSMLALGLGGCLFVLSNAAWNELQRRADQYGLAHEDANRFLRTINNYSVEISPDSQGRIILTPELMELGGLTGDKREVRMIGMSKRIEIWEESRAQAYFLGETIALDPRARAYEEVAKKLFL